MARIRIEALERPDEQALSAKQALGIVGAGPGIRGVYTGGAGTHLPYTWRPGVASPYYGGTTVIYGWGGFYPWYPWSPLYYQPPVIIEPVQPVIVDPWGW